MKNKKYYKNAISIAWPAVLESFFIALAGLIDTIMVSSLGSYAIAAVGLTTQPKFISMTFFFGINVALSALIARRRGENNKERGNQLFTTAFILTIILVIIISFITVVFAGPLIKIAGSSSDTHAPAKDYFIIIMSGMIFNAISMVINSAQRGSGNTRIAFTTNLTSSIVNIIFNYLLIGGKFGFPAMGIKGAALATVIGTLVASIMSIRSLNHKDTFVDMKYIFENRIKASIDCLKDILSLGSNMFMENIFMRVGFLTTALIAARLGTGAFAVHQVCMNFLSLAFSFADGMQVSAVALSGRSLGAGRKDEARIYGDVCQKIGLGISIILSVLLLLGGRFFLSLFFDQTEKALIDKGIIILRFVMVIVLMQISQIIYGGCLRSGGDVKYTLFVAIIAVAIIRTVVTIIATTFMNLGLIGIWIGIFSDQLSRFVLLRHRFKKGKWLDIKL